MSGIVGLFRRDGAPVTAEMLAPAMSAVAQYGADASGAWQSGSVGFGHRMLRLAPLSVHESQPFTRAHLTITADARIDNRAELFGTLGVHASEREHMSDCELVLRTYARWGEHCPEHLIGDYAFAIWDAQRQHLFCARDHIGARPFYYYITPKLFAFATDIRAVLAIPGVVTGIDETEIAKCLLSTSPAYHDNTRTFFRDLHKLPFAHRLSVNRESVRVGAYWKPEALREVRLPTIEDYADALHGLMERAVADRLRTDVAVGAHLSGGLDSSSVAVLAARILRQRGAEPPSVFSWSPPPGERWQEHEHRRIEAICRQEGLQAVYAAPTPDDEFGAESSGAGVRPWNSMQIESGVQREAEARGIQLMLSGWGGDEGSSFDGRGLAAQYLRERRWKSLADYLQLSAATRRRGTIVRGLRQIWSRAIVPTLPNVLFDVVARTQSLHMRGKPLIEPQFAERIRPQLPPAKERLREVASARAVQFGLYHNGHMASRMESWASYGADHGLVYAYPLADRRVLEFVYSIPADLFYHKGYTRYLYRHTVSRLLPEGVPWDTVKHDTALHERSEKQRQRMGDYLRASEHLCVPNPWVPVDRLRRELSKAPTAQGGHRFATRHALSCLAIWNRWQATAPAEVTASREA